LRTYAFQCGGKPEVKDVAMIPSHEGAQDSLEPLRYTLAARAEMAYHLRDMEGTSEISRAYAAGEAHAYAVAEEDVRVAERACAHGNDR
jgi:hypothetical protein